TEVQKENKSIAVSRSRHALWAAGTALKIPFAGNLKALGFLEAASEHARQDFICLPDRFHSTKSFAGQPIAS
ncbi:hypothetical protein, partial [Roseibium sp.]|uniref:hypothetical protein n=1 Tax=Roseibium sp. TaxID=1936156 RepID=UPI003D1426C5